MASSKKATIVERVANVLHIDGWINALTGLGIKGMDTRVDSVLTWAPMSEDDCANVYSADSMAAKICDRPVDDATQKGYKWTGIKDDQIKKLTAALTTMDFDAHLQKAWKVSRRDGGAGILKLYDDQLDLGSPRVEGKALKALLTLSRWELRTEEQDLNRDILSPMFRRPVTYRFSGRGSETINRSDVPIHHSRIVRFPGSELPDIHLARNGYWEDSYLNRVKEAIRNFAHAHDSINLALKDISVAVLKVSGLAGMLESNCDTMITNRLQAVNLAKGIARMVVVDKDGEDFDYKVRNLTGAADLVIQAANRLVAESGFPHTILLGDSPTGGLGQSGNHESEVWYSKIESEQNNFLKPRMLEIAREKCVELGIDPKDLGVEFNELWQLSEKETAEVRRTTAETDKIYYEMGVVDTTEIAKSRFGSGKYSMETNIDFKARERQNKPREIPGAEGLDAEAVSAAEEIQGKALNGAQVASLVQVATMNQANQLDPSAAKAIIQAAFPTLSEEQVATILTKSAKVKPPPPAPAPGGGGGFGGR